MTTKPTLEWLYSGLYDFSPLRPDDWDARLYLRISRTADLPGRGRMGIVFDHRTSKSYLIRSVRVNGIPDYEVVGEIVDISTEPPPARTPPRPVTRP